MELTENQEATIPPPVLILNAEAQSYLMEAGKWANFLAIVGFIFCGLILIMALFVGTIFSALARLSPSAGVMPAGVGAFMSIFYILIDVLYFFFPLYLVQFAGRVKKGILFSSNETLTEGIGKLKSFFKLWGIVTIVAIAFYVLILLIAIIAGISAASLSH